MKLNPTLLKVAQQNSDVLPGNVYPAKGGRKSPGTEFWLVVAVSGTGAHCIGYDRDGNPVSTASYLKSALRERPVVCRANLSSIELLAERGVLRAEAEARLTVAQQPTEQHPDDAAVDRFAAAMKAKLKKKRQEGRAGWQSMTSEQLSALLHEHVRKGDPVDVANLAMMLHQNGQAIEPPPVVADEMVETPKKGRGLWKK